MNPSEKDGQPSKSDPKPAIDSSKSGEIWKSFVSGPLSQWLRADLSSLLVHTDGLEDKVTLIAEALSHFPDESKALRTAVASQRRSKELPPLPNTIRMYGVMNALSFAVVCKAAEVFGPKILPKNPQTQLFATAPQQILSYAHKALKIVGEDSRYRDITYAAGCVFDLLALQNQLEPSAEVRGKVTALLEAGFLRAAGAAKVGLLLARQMKRLPLEPDLPASLFLGEAAKVAAAAMIPAYADALKKWNKGGVDWAEKRNAELSQFHGGGIALADPLSWVAPSLLKEAGSLAGLVDYPGSLALSIERDAADLASIAFLALYIQEHPELLKDGKILKASDITPELAHFAVSIDFAKLARELVKVGKAA